MIKELLNTRYMAIALTVLLVSLALFGVSAIVPIGPTTLTRGADETQTPDAALSTTAAAGNITQLTLTASTQTKHWQGYYGDITGTIVLDDADDYTLYDWPLTEPKGEIYALTNAGTPAWANVHCFNFSGGSDGAGANNLTVYETFYDMTWNDVDGIDETFNMTTHEQIDVGTVRTIQPNTCPSTFMHQNDTFQSDKFSQVLLQDRTNGYLIFTAIIENDDTANNTDVQGFKGTVFTPDFQMLVAEDGTSLSGSQINTDRTTYYFYVDLE